MARVLIDANMYLKFYESTQMAKLLPLLRRLKRDIFITSQIVAEVNRNKVTVTNRFLGQNLPKSPLKYSIPSTLLSLSAGDEKKLKKRADELANRSTALFKTLKETYVDAVKQIARSGDPVSKALEELFVLAVRPGTSELNHARLRKEAGNPPGKREDPLGDQITWEQFLSHASGQDAVWIITEDKDFYEELLDGTIALNAYLDNELRTVAKASVEVHCFTSLAEGLQHYSSHLKKKPPGVPTPDEFKRIIQEEPIRIKHPISGRGFFEICPICRAIDKSDCLGCTTAENGVKQEHFQCTKCGTRYFYEYS